MIEADPHKDQPIHHRGAEPGEARLAMILLHGRGSEPADIFRLAERFSRPEIAYLAPEAKGRIWHPQSFLAPILLNEPHLSSACGLIESAIAGLAQAGLPPERIVLLGLSQGACIALEFAARHGRRFGGLCAFSGGFFGEAPSAELYRRDLAGTPAFLGCSDVDPYIPLGRVELSGAILGQLGANPDKRIYPGMGHIVNADEIAWINDLIDRLLLR